MTKIHNLGFPRSRRTSRTKICRWNATGVATSISAALHAVAAVLRQRHWRLQASKRPGFDSGRGFFLLRSGLGYQRHARRHSRAIRFIHWTWIPISEWLAGRQTTGVPFVPAK
jgi:hypothetical protein